MKLSSALSCLLLFVEDVSSAVGYDTMPPTQLPTKRPTMSPIKPPTKPPSTKPPNNAPIQGNPTLAPTKPPNNAPIQGNPTIVNPTLAPTKPPNNAPIRGNPTIVNPTLAPTLAPTQLPTSSPATCICGIPKAIPSKCEVKLLIDMLDFAIAGDHKLASQWLRLSFHDAGTFDQNVPEGGANGCLMNHPMMRDQPENAHLDLAIETLRTVRDNWEVLPSTCIDISSADIIQFAGLFAVVRQTGKAPGLTSTKIRKLLTFQWGRPDEVNCNTNWTLNLPEFALGTDRNDVPLRCMMAGGEIKNTMMNKNGFSIEEATALIGAHTIGLTRNTFGDPAPWVENGADDATSNGPVFDNAYFDFLENTINATTPAAFAVDPSPFITQFPDWFQTSPTNKLNHLDTDIVLAFPTQDANVHPDFHGHTVAFSNNNAYFLKTFHRALTKMSKLGVTNVLSRSKTTDCSNCDNAGGVVVVGLTVPDLLRLSADLGGAKATAESLLAKKQEDIKEQQKEQTTPVKKFKDTTTVDMDLDPLLISG